MYLQTGWSLADSAKKYGITLASLEAEVERRAKAKRNEVLTPKVDFVYESAQMEDAVNSVLCGTSIKDAASAYGVSKNSLKQVILYCCIMMHSHVICVLISSFVEFLYAVVKYFFLKLVFESGSDFVMFSLFRP